MQNRREGSYAGAAISRVIFQGQRCLQIDGASIAGRPGAWLLRLVPGPTLAWVPADDGAESFEEVVVDSNTGIDARNKWIKAKNHEAIVMATPIIKAALAARNE